MTSDVELSGVRIPSGASSSLFRTGIRQNLLSAGRAGACATNVAFGIGRGAQTVMDAIGRDEPPPVSRNASWTVFRVQTKSELLPESRPPYIFSNAFFLSMASALLTAR
jgi:hypothetical protein